MRWPRTLRSHVRAAPRPGIVAAGAMSSSGRSTKARSCMRGCGTIRRDCERRRRPKSSRSRSSKRGALRRLPLRSSVLGWRRRPRYVRGRRFAFAPATARAPVFLWRLVGTEHAFALVAVRALEAFPPVGELNGNLAAVAAQPEKIVSGAEARMLEQSERPLAGALFEPRL